MPSLYAVPLIIFLSMVSTLHDTLYQRTVGFLWSKLCLESLAVHVGTWKDKADVPRTALRSVNHGWWLQSGWERQGGWWCVCCNLLHSSSNPVKLTGEENGWSRQTVTRLIFVAGPIPSVGVILWIKYGDCSCYSLLKCLYVSLCSLTSSADINRASVICQVDARTMETVVNTFPVNSKNLQSRGETPTYQMHTDDTIYLWWSIKIK